MADSPSSESADNTSRARADWNGLQNYARTNKVEMGLWATRLFTIFFTLGYFIPLFGNPYNAYYKALISSAATSSLRLYQRFPRTQLNLRFIELLLLEDACHYLFYAFMFLYVSPFTMVLAPIFLFALLHFSSRTLTLIDFLGQNSWWPTRLMISLVEFQTSNILRMCALCEIMLLPLTMILVFTGNAGLLTPFVYYQFLRMRLTSRRNHYTRNTFFEIRNALAALTINQSIPGILRYIVNGLLTVTQHMTPPVVQSN